MVSFLAPFLHVSANKYVNRVRPPILNCLQPVFHSIGPPVSIDAVSSCGIIRGRITLRGLYHLQEEQSDIQIHLQSTFKVLDKEVQEQTSIILPHFGNSTLIRLASKGFPAENQATAVATAITNRKGCWIACVRQNIEWLTGHCALRESHFPERGHVY